MKKILSGVFMSALFAACGSNSVNPAMNNSVTNNDSMPDSLKADADSSTARVQRSIDSMDTRIEEVFDRRDSL